MTRYFAGGDVGSTKTNIIIADEHGRVLGFGTGGGGNHEGVGYAGLQQVVHTACAASTGTVRHRSRCN